MALTTWTGVISTNAATAGNWDTLSVPTSADDAVIDGTGSNDCLGAITGLTIDFSGYAGNATGVMTPYGDITFSAGMSFTPSSINVSASSNIVAAGQAFGNLNLSPGVTATLTDDADINGGYFQAGSVLSLNAGINLTWSPEGGDLLELADNTVGISFPGSGETCIIVPPAGSTANLLWASSPEFLPDTTMDVTGSGFIKPVATPRFDSLAIMGPGTGGLRMVGGSGIDVIGNFSATDAYLSDGDTTPDMGGQTITVGGNFDVDNTALSTGFIAVTGTAFAHNTTITNMDFSGGTQLDATDNCVDGGGNTNVLFAITATDWTNGGADGDAANAANWTNGVPDATLDTAFAGSNDDVLVWNGISQFLTLDFLGYTGEVPSDQFEIYGTLCRFVNAMTFSGAGGLALRAMDGSVVQFYSGGLDWYSLENPSGQTDGDIVLAENARTASIVMRGTSDFDMGAFELISVVEDDNEDGLYFVGSSTISYSPGAKISWPTSTPGTTFDLEFDLPGQTLPPIEINASGKVYLITDVKPESWLQGASSGGLYNDSGYVVETVGDFTALGGKFTNDGTADDYGAQPIVVGGNFSMTDVQLNNAVVTVTGTAEAHDCLISNCDFSGGTGLDATDGCVDGGGNTNVTFGAVVDTTWIGAFDTDWSNPLNWSDGVPNSAQIAFINASAPGDVVLSETGYCKSIDFTGFAGNFSCGGFPLFLHGTYATFSAGMTVSNDVMMAITPLATSLLLTSAGKKMRRIDVQAGAGLVLADDLTVNEMTVDAASFDLDSFKVFIEQVDPVLTMSCNFASGTISFEPDFAQLVYNIPEFPADTAFYTPPVLTGPDLVVNGFAPNASSFSIQSGTAIALNMEFTNCNISDNVFQAEISAEAHATTFTLTSFAGGVPCDATDSCIDGEGNTNIDFAPGGPSVVSVATLHSPGTFALGEVIDILVTFDQAAIVTGTPRLPIGLRDGRTRVVYYLSGSGTTVLTFRLTALALDSFNVLRTVPGADLDLFGGTIRDVADNNADLTIPQLGESGALDAQIAVSHATAKQPPTHGRRLGMIR